MNLKYSEKTSERAFVEALEESKVVQNWLLNRLTGYINVNDQVTLEIGIDPWTKTDKPSFCWAIYSQPIDDYGKPVQPVELKGIINGGLIYRGEDNYSSHT